MVLLIINYLLPHASCFVNSVVSALLNPTIPVDTPTRSTASNRHKGWEVLAFPQHIAGAHVRKICPLGKP